MHVVETGLPGVLILEPRVFGDNRGHFFESYRQSLFRTLGIRSDFVQDNHSFSRRHSLRGLHYQLRHSQAKLCRVVRGSVIDVTVDIRRGSPHFGKWTKTLLSGENRRQVYVPKGFAHGFVVTSAAAEFLYKCDEEYDPTDEYGIAWNDPQLAIAWEIDVPVLSDRDRAFPRLSDIPAGNLPVYRES